MKNKIIASVMAVTMVFGAAGIVLPENNVFGTQLTHLEQLVAAPQMTGRILWIAKYHKAHQLY